MESKNIDILKGIFKWVSISEISELEMKKLAENMDIQLPDNFLLIHDLFF